MALVDPNIALSYKPVEIPQQRNMLAEAAQVMSLQQAKMQMDKIRQTDEAMERIRQVAMQHGGPNNLEEIGRAYMQSPDAQHQALGLSILQKQKEKSDFERMGRQLYPELFAAAPAAAPTAAAAPLTAAAPAAAPANALAPAAAPAAPVNALVAPAAAPTQPLSPSGKTRRELEGIIFLAQQNPLYKGMAETAKLELQEMIKGQAPTELGRLIAARDALPPGDPRRATYNAAINKSVTHAPGTTVNVSTEKAYGSAFGGKLADVDIGKMTTAEKAPALADSANRIIGLVQQGNVFTGPAADIKLNLARALNVAGANNQEKIANTESLIAATGKSTLDAIHGAGLGTGQGFTDKDLKFLQGVAGGTINLTAQTLTELATLQHRVATKAAESWNKRVKEMPQNVVQGTGLSTTPITVPPLSSVMKGKGAAASAPAVPAGVDPALWSVMTPQERALWQTK